MRLLGLLSRMLSDFVTDAVRSVLGPWPTSGTLEEYERWTSKIDAPAHRSDLRSDAGCRDA